MPAVALGVFVGEVGDVEPEDDQRTYPVGAFFRRQGAQNARFQRLRGSIDPTPSSELVGLVVFNEADALGGFREVMQSQRVARHPNLLLAPPHRLCQEQLRPSSFDLRGGELERSSSSRQCSVWKSLPRCVQLARLDLCTACRLEVHRQ